MTMPDAITEALPPDDRMRIGTVASVDPLTVNVQGTLVPVGRLGTYGPVVGEPTALLRQDQTWLALGSTVGSGGSGRGIALVEYVAATGNLNLNAGAATVPGTTINFTVPSPNSILMAWWIADIEVLGTTATTGEVRLSVDGLPVNPQVIITQTGAAIGFRATLAQQTVRAIAAGAHTISLNGIRVSGVDNQLRANATHTTLTIMVLG
jgi:hypothetical protein